jgi:hypothetical protein
LKYLILSNYRPILFPCEISHRDIASRFMDYQIVSAGFVKLENGKVVTYGESISLGLKAKETDAKIIETLMKGSNE